MNRSRLLLDQMLDAEVATVLRQHGWDVVRVSELDLSTAADDQVLESASCHDRVLITLDEHFGDWAVLPLDSHPGVIRVKTNPATSPNILALLVPFLNEHQQRSFRDHLVIVKLSSIRWIRTSR